MIDYLTLLNSTSGELREKGSKFYSFAYPIKSMENFNKYHQLLKEKFTDSSHICYAYRLVVDDRIDEFATDDGEPKGSSGLPILNSIKQQELVNCAVFVIRYFGGTKLGIPGLIASYGGCAKVALGKVKIVSWHPTTTVWVNHNYDQNRLIESVIKQFTGKILKQNFKETVQTNIEIRPEQKNEFDKVLFDKSAGKLRVY
jgi:uncharacterized YigZ family protein